MQCNTQNTPVTVGHLCGEHSYIPAYVCTSKYCALATPCAHTCTPPTHTPAQVHSHAHVCKTIFSRACTLLTLLACISPCFLRCLCLKTCSDAVALLENWPQEGGAPFIKGKAFFWQAVILHEQVVRCVDGCLRTQCRLSVQHTTD